MLPSIKKIEEAVNRPTTATSTEPIPYVEPTAQGTQILTNITDDDWLSGDLTQKQREDIRNDPNINIG